MKRFIIVLCAFFIAGCSSQSAASPAPKSSAIASVAASSEVESRVASSESDLTVEKGLLDVTITFPPEFMGEDSKSFDADAYAKEEGFKSAVVNEDGSLTVTMSKSKHTELIKEIKSEIEKTFNGYIGSKDTPYIKSFESDEDYKTITIFVDKTGYKKSEDMTPFSVGLQASIYQMFKGIEMHCDVSVKDVTTGEVLYTLPSN